MGKLQLCPVSLEHIGELWYGNFSHFSLSHFAEVWSVNCVETITSVTGSKVVRLSQWLLLHIILEEVSPRNLDKDKLAVPVSN